ncbi:aminotransferase-like domain-containing protein [Nonomuraea sp. SBT364]|uniref:aminotransferase-like domain-containing protein n=1 Tax=Nonomuraea sp. SBT364 TaxID=1580530 RepID=UPI00066A3FEE|nr:PLP-dependent aminotransferase family protein [Nonomuraea sp. SBT364]
MVRRVPASQFPRLLGDWRVGDGTLAKQLAVAIEKAVHDGRLPLGVRLPAERLLAGELGLARGTVAACYHLLRAEQLIITRTGSGSTTRLPPRLHDRLSPWASDRGQAGRSGAALDLTRAEPAAPFDELLQAVHAAADTLPAALLHDTAGGHGPSTLHTAIADAYCAQGFATHGEHLLLTSGADAALSLLSAAYLRQSSRVVLDSPTYPGALAIFRAAGARLVAQPLRSSGWDIPALDRTLQAARPSLTYLIPDFHNPTGLLMSEEERGELRRRLRAHDTVVVFDETMRDLDLRGHAIAPPRTVTRAGDRNVVHVGSLSKVLWPGLRVGWIRAHPDVIHRLAALPLAAALAPSPFDRLVAAQLVEHQATILDRRRAQLRIQRDHLVSRLSALPWCRFQIPQGGLSLWLELLDIDSSRLASRAASLNLSLTPGFYFSPDGALGHYLRLPFTLPPEALDAAVDRLTEAHAAP